MQDLAQLLGYRYAAVYNRSRGRTNDFVLLPVFFIDNYDTMSFLEDFCNKAGEGYIIYSSYGLDFTTAYVEDLEYTKRRYPTVTSQEMEGLRNENH